MKLNMRGILRKIIPFCDVPWSASFDQLMLIFDEKHSIWARRSRRTHLSHSTARTTPDKTLLGATDFVKLVFRMHMDFLIQNPFRWILTINKLIYWFDAIKIANHQHQFRFFSLIISIMYFRKQLNQKEKPIAGARSPVSVEFCPWINIFKIYSFD